MSEVTAIILSIITHAILVTLVIVGALVALRWLWRLADVAAIQYLERKYAKVKAPVQPPELMSTEWEMWSAPDFAVRDHAAAIMLTAKKLRFLRILPHIEIALITHDHGADHAKKRREFKSVLSRTYVEMKEAEAPHGKSD